MSAEVSKAAIYTVLAPPDGVNVSKAAIYTVLVPPDGVNVSKAAVYTVLRPKTVTPAGTRRRQMVNS